MSKERKKTPLETKFAALSKRFREKISIDLVPLAPFKIDFTFKGEKITESFSKKDILVALDTVCPAVGTKNHEIQVDNLIQLIENIGFEIALSSSPLAFRRAWNSRSSELDQSEIDAIANEGGQLIPAQPEHTHRLYRKPKRDSGLVKFPTGGKAKLLRAVRHVHGNYNDELGVFGTLHYQTDKKASGILLYRFMEELSTELETTIPIQLLTHFKTPTPDSSVKHEDHRIKYFFITTFAKINTSSSKKWNKNWFKAPLDLKLASVNEIRKTLHYISSLSEMNNEFAVRPPLSEEQEVNWSYTKIGSNSLKRGKAIRLWAQKVNLKCPDGNGPKCVGNLNNATLSQIHIGHIISQNWAQAYLFLDQAPGKAVNHPDNLYLTCYSCNTKLNKNFPTNNVRSRIESEKLTIGDLIRTNENEIKKHL